MKSFFKCGNVFLKSRWGILDKHPEIVKKFNVRKKEVDENINSAQEELLDVIDLAQQTVIVLKVIGSTVRTAESRREGNHTGQASATNRPASIIEIPRLPKPIIHNLSL